MRKSSSLPGSTARSRPTVHIVHYSLIPFLSPYVLRVYQPHFVEDCCSVLHVAVGVGMVMSEVGRPTTAMGIVDGVLQSFATGTFIFVTFFEILQEEIDPRDTSVSKVSSALAGFVVISLLIMIPVDSESSDDSPSEHGNTTVDVLSNYTTVPLQT